MSKQDEILKKFLQDPIVKEKYAVDPESRNNTSFVEVSSHPIVDLIKFIIDQSISSDSADTTIRGKVVKKAQEYAVRLRDGN